jgi:hypothetical protein
MLFSRWRGKSTTADLAGAMIIVAGTALTIQWQGGRW